MRLLPTITTLLSIASCTVSDRDFKATGEPSATGDAGVTDDGKPHEVTPGAELASGGRVKSATYTLDVQIGARFTAQPMHSATYSFEATSPIKP